MFPFMGFCYTKTVNLNLFMRQAIMYSGFYCSPSHGGRVGMSLMRVVYMLVTDFLFLYSACSAS